MVEVDFTLLKGRAANLTARELVGIAESLGWHHVRTRGSHHHLRKAGRRTLTISEHRNRVVYLKIIRKLEAEARGE